MPVQKRLAKVGLAKQTSKGSAAAEATYQLGVLSGAVAGAEVTEENLDPTSTSRIVQDAERLLVVPGLSCQVVGMPRSIGLLLLAACGAVATVGAAAPYSHTFTPGDDLPYLTVFGRYGAQYTRIRDAKVNQLELTFERSGAIRAQAQVMGLDLSYLAAAFTVASGGDESPRGDALRAAGGLFSFDGGTARVKGGQITIGNELTVVEDATKILPDDVFPGLQPVSWQLTVVPDDLTAWRKNLTGSTSGSSVVQAIHEGACSMKWVKDVDTDLTFSAARSRLTIEMPEADPAGGPAEVTIAGETLVPASGNAYEFLLRNAVAAY